MRDGCEISEELATVFELLGKRWNGKILGALLEFGPAHFAELRDGIPGISDRILSTRLGELADAGLVVREVDQGPPLRVVYGLTEAGEGLRPALELLFRWAGKYKIVA